MSPDQIGAVASKLRLGCSGCRSPDCFHWKYHLAGKYRGLIQYTIAVLVFRYLDAIKQIFFELCGRHVESGTITDKESAGVVEAASCWMSYQRRACEHLRTEAGIVNFCDWKPLGHDGTTICVV